MPRNRPIGAFGIFSEGDVPDFENDYYTSVCCFCGKRFDVLGRAEIFIHVLTDVRYAHNKRPRDGRRAGTGGPICFRCFNAGPQLIADRYDKQVARLKRPDNKDEAVFGAAIFRKFPDFTGFKRYKLAKAIADAQ
jgi:hypothetical protein